MYMAKEDFGANGLGSIKGGTKIFYDNNSAIKLSQKVVLDLVGEGVIVLEYYGTSLQIVDIMTKSVKLDVFENHRHQCEN
ncbi:hypothetical protein V2J09_017894 [Rumex salicifolius]